jgi:hypothetical protein
MEPTLLSGSADLHACINVFAQKTQAAELQRILASGPMRALLATHDTIARNDFGKAHEPPPVEESFLVQDVMLSNGIPARNITFCSNERPLV